MEVDLKKTILLVENELVTASLANRFNEKTDYQLFCVHSGIEAIEIVLKNQNIDLILMDIDLNEGLNGLETSFLILKESDIPILYLSSWTEATIDTEILQATTYGYVHKDSDISTIDASIQKALKLFQENKKLKECKDKYKFLYETIRDGTICVDLNGYIIESNAVFQKMTGYSGDELRLLTYHDITPEKWHENESKVVSEQLLVRGFTDPYEKEYRRKDGSICPVEISVYQHSNSSGFPRFHSAIVRDLSETKRHEAQIRALLDEKDLTLKEVHHRIKNNMNTIYSLLLLQAETVHEPEAISALEDAGSRVQSMALLYDKLYRSDSYKTVSMIEYLPVLIDEIVSNFPAVPKIRIEKKIDDFSVNSKLVQIVGIIVNELLTNIMKYAFVGRDDGAVSISARCSDGTIFIVIADNGNGMPDSICFDSSPGFGLLLISQLTKQIGGTIRIERDKGTRIVLECSQ